MILFEIIYAILTDTNGVFWVFLFKMVFIVFLINTLIKTGILKFLFKSIIFTVRLVFKSCIILCNTVLFTYSFVMLYLYCKEKEYQMKGFLKNRTLDALGLKFINQAGQTVEIAHPKYLKKVLNIFYKLVGVTRRLFINFDRAFAKVEKM